MRRALTLFILAIACAGCHFGTPPDPNDPKIAGTQQVEVLRRQLKGASDSLLARVASGEIDDAEFNRQISLAANEILKGVKIENIPPEKAWEYAEVFRTARRWDESRQAFETAVKVAKNMDRKVNDSLHLAVVYAELKRYDDAIGMALSVINVPAEASSPILPAVLLELLPAMENANRDLALAGLLEEAIRAEVRTVVDPRTKPGHDFLVARPFHLRNAWHEVVLLYRKAGDTQKAQKAASRMQQMLEREVRI